MKLFFLCAIFFCAAIVKGQNVNTITSEALQLETSMRDEQALTRYKEALVIQPSNVFLLCKCSELSNRVGNRLEHDESKQNYLFNSAKSYAREAIRLDSTSSEANFVMALARGHDALHGGGKDKIDAVKDIKKYADLSIHYDHNNYKAWYVLGQWYFEINSLNFFEKTAVKIFFGALPPGSIEDAIHCFEKAKILNPGFVLNYLSLAKAYKQKDENEAKQNLITMLSLPDRTQDDERIKNEGRVLLKRWN